MSHSRKPSHDAAFDSLTSRFRDSVSCYEDSNKPDFKELDLGSPVSPLTSRGLINNTNHVPSNSSSSASSSGSVSGKATSTPQLPKRLENGAKSYSAEFSGLSEISPPAHGSVPTIRNAKPGHRRSVSAGPPLIYSGSSFTTTGNVSHGNGATSVSSHPNPNVLPSGNICPSGKILKTGMAARVSNRTDTLCMGTGNYGHGNIVRGNGKLGGAGNAVEGNMQKVTGSTIDAEEVKRAGNEMYRKGNFMEALALYDKAISISPENAAYRSNRAATLTALGRIAEAVRECEEAVRLDPGYTRANQRLVSLYLRCVS